MSAPYKKAIVRKVSRRTILEWGGASLGLLLAACKSDSGHTVDTGADGPEALEPITPISDFYVVSHFGMAEVDVSTWTLELTHNAEGNCSTIRKSPPSCFKCWFAEIAETCKVGY